MSISDKLLHTSSPITARELLIEVAGKEHALHTVVGKLADQPKGQIVFRCSCGGLNFVKETPENELALQNVPVEKSKKQPVAKQSPKKPVKGN